MINLTITPMYNQTTLNVTAGYGERGPQGIQGSIGPQGPIGPINPNSLSKLTDITHNFSAPHFTGTITATGPNWVEMSGANFTENQYVDHAVRMINPDFDSEYCFIISNTSNRLYMDCEFDFTPSGELSILDTVILDSDLECEIACIIYDNDGAIILPEATLENNRLKADIYIERAINGNHKLTILTRGEQKIRDNKYVTLEHQYEGITLMSHFYSPYHYDIVNTRYIKRYITAYFNGTYSLTSTAYIPITTLTNVTINNAKRFIRMTKEDGVWAKYTSKIPTTFVITGHMNFEKQSAGPISNVALSVRVKDHITSLTRDLTETECTFKLGNSGSVTVPFSLTVKLNYGDEIAIIAKRDTGTIIIEPGGSIIVNEI